MKNVSEKEVVSEKSKQEEVSTGKSNQVCQIPQNI